MAASHTRSTMVSTSRLVLVLALATLCTAAAVPKQRKIQLEQFHGKDWLDLKQWVEDTMQQVEDFVTGLWDSATSQVEQFVHDTGIDDAVNKALADIQKIIDDAAALGQDVVECAAADKDQIIRIGGSVLIDTLGCIAGNVGLLVQINNAKTLVERVLAEDAACDGDLICRAGVWWDAEGELTEILGSIIADIAGGINPIVAQVVAAAPGCATSAATNALPAIEALAADVIKCAVA